MHVDAAAGRRTPGRATLGIVAHDLPDGKVAENLIHLASRRRPYRLVEAGLVVREREIPLSECLTESRDDLLPLAITDPDAQIGSGRKKRPWR
jgi:hypothetical protein